MQCELKRHGNQQHVSIGRRFIPLFLGLLLALANSTWAAEPKVVLGLGSGDAAKYNVEFMQYDRMLPLYAQNHIQASLMEAGGLCGRDETEEQLYQNFKKYHVITVGTSSEGVYKLDDTFRKRAAVAGKALARYVQEGGGLIVYPAPVRYPGSDDEKYWNLVFAPFGLELLHEGVVDKTRAFGNNTFWSTRNIQAHPVTEGVSGLCLPLYGLHGPGIVAMKYSPEWEMLVRGEKEAKSYRSGADNALNLATEGFYTSAPPVLAVRTFGKGRVACYPLSGIHSGGNYGNPLWPQIVESKGDQDSGRPSDSVKMQMNAYRWLAEPAMKIAGFGTYKPEPYASVQFPKSVNWDALQFGKPFGGDTNFTYPDGQQPMTMAPPTASVRGIFGIHTAYTDGKGTVANYAQAAKAAGLAFIVFADPLEKLTPKKLEKLKADCAEASKAGDFYACPGIEFTDGIGNRWAFWGEKVVWPDNSFKDKNTTFVQWDGTNVNHYGEYIAACGYVGSALLDYKQLRANGAHPENLWWFFHYLPLVYDHGKLAADNYPDYLFGLRDMRWAAISSFTRITDPAEVAAAAGLCYTGFNSLPNAKAALNTRCGAYAAATASGQYVSQGPVIVSWEAINQQLEDNWKYTRGAQRVRLKFTVKSDVGIVDVKVHDADRGPIRRFLGRGEKQLAREFELVSDQQHYLTLEVSDTAGKRAFANYILVFCYKGGLFRCGDNLNILGPTAMCWHPDRNEFFRAAKDFRNGADYALSGWDTSEAGTGVPAPWAYLGDMITLKETGEYPHGSRQHAISGRLMDVGINNYNLQIATMRMTKLSESFDDAKRPTPAMATVARDTGDIEYYDRTHTIYAPMERVDMFTTWNYRRGKEGRKDYQGGIIWHEGEYRFKKDATLTGDVPIPLFWDRCPVDVAKSIGTAAVVTDAAVGNRFALLQDPKVPVQLRGRLRPGGYAAWMNTPVGYHAFLAPVDMNFSYDANLVSSGSLRVGLGENGQVVKAGTVLKYRFGVATFTDSKGGNDLLEHTVKAMNLGGGQAGYPVEMKAGEVKDAVFFFTAAAKDNEALFTLGPQKLIIDLPIRVQGLENNGCVAIHSTAIPRFRFVPVDADGTAWLTEPIDQKNEMWVGNVFACDNKDVKLTLVVDGQAEKMPPLLEVHNPTDKEIATTLKSPPHTPVFAGLAAKVTVPAGDSVWLVLREGKLVPRE